MFGFSLVIVGSLPNTQIASVINTARQNGDAEMIDSARQLHVSVSNWCGDWHTQVASALKSGSDEVIVDPPSNGNFYVTRRGVLEWMDDITCPPTIDMVMGEACHSLIDVGLREYRGVYGVAMTAQVFSRVNARKMLACLATRWDSKFSGDDWSFGPSAPPIRLFIIKKNGVKYGSFDMSGDLTAVDARF